MHDSTSSFGQWVHDHLPNQFWFVDSDGAVIKRAPDYQCQIARRVLPMHREFEHKRFEQSLDDVGPGQRLRLALQSWAVREQVHNEQLHSDSGVYVVFADFHRSDSGSIVTPVSARVIPVLPTYPDFQVAGEHLIDAEGLSRLISCRSQLNQEVAA